MECKAIGILTTEHEGGRFNRYIVECKDAIRRPIDEVRADLIDTLWNVKLQKRKRGCKPILI